MSSNTTASTIAAIVTLFETTKSRIPPWLLGWLPMVAMIIRFVVIAYQHVSMLETTEMLETTMGVDTVFSVTPEALNRLDGDSDEDAEVVTSTGVNGGKGKRGAEKRWAGKGGAAGQQRYGVEGVCPYY